nr:hypothetical protein [uncultured Oscillibacter sp.]
MSAQKKNKTPDLSSRQAEMEGARLFGRHVSRTKGRLLLAVTLVCCALPVILGLRLWGEIPEIVETGLIGADGKDDSLPRAAVVFALPGLMCVLDLLAHYQLLVNQRRMTVPKPYVRLVGRWGFPIISVLFCGGMMLQSAGRAWDLSFVAPCVLGLLLLLLGSHMWDCPRDSRVSLGFALAGRPGADWDGVHHLTGGAWLAAGLLAIAGTMAGVPWVAAVCGGAALIVPAACVVRQR